MTTEFAFGAFGVVAAIVGFVVGRNDRYVSRSEMAALNDRINALQGLVDTINVYLLNHKSNGGAP